MAATSLLECVVCLEVPSSNPIFQCRNGHHYCKECHPKLLCFMISSKLHECPLCQQERDVKCLIAQKVLENSKETRVGGRRKVISDGGSLVIRKMVFFQKISNFDSCST